MPLKSLAAQIFETQEAAIAALRHLLYPAVVNPPTTENPMTDASQYHEQPAVPAETSPEDAMTAQELYEQLKPAAIAAAREYVLRQTPANLQDEMAEVIEADLPLPEVPVIKMPWPGRQAIGQFAAQAASAAAAESKVEEIKEKFDPPPMPAVPAGPAPDSGSAPPTHPPAALDQPAA